MSTVYEESRRIKDIAEALITKHHTHLSRASIGYVTKKAEEGTDQKALKPGREGKQKKAAKARKVPAIYLLLTGLDFIIEADERMWNTLTIEQQEALIDHELCHCALDENGWYLRDHDVEEFRAIIERHGFWHDGLEHFVSVAQTVLPFQTSIQ